MNEVKEIDVLSYMRSITPSKPMNEELKAYIEKPPSMISQNSTIRL